MRSEKAAYLILVIYFGSGWSPERTEGKQCGNGFYRVPNMTCIDDNECGDTQSISNARCGVYTECHNTFGSFYCTCRKGYITQAGNANFTTMTNCHDDNECGDTQSISNARCGVYTECHNTFGSFYCTCRKGYITQAGNANFTTMTNCHDDNECGDTQSISNARCGVYTECHNTFGSFYCTCRKGYITQAGNVNFTTMTNCHDDNECGDTQSSSNARCGANTECHNTFGSFYCTCRKGYITQAGNANFTTMTNCHDINECETNPCGLNATCTNMFGGFECTCDDGFVSTTGERTFTDKTKTRCRDINECETNPCGLNATCTNMFGGFECTCDDGFVSTTGERTFTDKTKTRCRDINECETNPCGLNATCTNMFGGFECTCDDGFVSTTGERTFTDKTKTRCRDINECETNPCGLNATCTNMFGGFECTCDDGFVSTTGERTFTDKTKTRCRELTRTSMNQCSLNNLTGQTSHSAFQTFCSQMNSIANLINGQWQNQSGTPPLQVIISNASDLLGNDSLWENMEKEQRLLSASILLQSMKDLVIATGLNLPDQGKKNSSSKNIDVEIRTFRGKNNSSLERVTLLARGNMMDIYRQTATGRKTNGTDFAAVALIAFRNMDPILNGSVFNSSSTGGKLETFELISNVVSAVIINGEGRDLSPAVTFTFRHTKKPNKFWPQYCAHWNYAAGKSYWSPNGCHVSSYGERNTQCQCTHLSSLALLISPYKQPMLHPGVIAIIANVVLCVSVVCLGISVMTFALCSSLKSALNATHMHLCLSLFLAELLFLVGIEETRNRVVCGIIAGFLHYFFLAAFFWMFLEAVQLYNMIRNIRNLRVSLSKKIKKFTYPFGYGGPAIIVIISVAVYPDGYGSHTNCWLNVNRGLVWSFLGPVYLIIAVNTVLFFTFLWILKREVAKRDTQVSKLNDTRMMTFKAIAQIFVLGCTWILGIGNVPGGNVVMFSIFTIINSLQGTFIFILLCVLNPKVRAEYRKFFARMCKAKDTRASLTDAGNTMITMSS
ncbi:adhesion G protein-coupled receptor E1-like [Scyliorhinus torazame]|uniref:adhesion G protein-coupled receptor E1-like n=1 Tax=Scyliorhinus torazame TaxID=75743 RepID=UPI003B5CCDCD